MKFLQQVKMEESLDAVSLLQHVERDVEATSLPVSVTADWLEEDANETTWNQFQQPDWQVRETQMLELDAEDSSTFFNDCTNTF